MLLYSTIILVSIFIILLILTKKNNLNSILDIKSTLLKLSDSELINNSEFKMTIEDIFSIKGRGIVIVGIIEKGVINIGDNIKIIGINKFNKIKVVGINAYYNKLEHAQEGDNISLTLEGIERDNLIKGQIIIK